MQPERAAQLAVLLPAAARAAAAGGEFREVHEALVVLQAAVGVELRASVGVGPLWHLDGGLGGRERVLHLALHPLHELAEACRDENDDWYDRYKGMKELMPYAKAVSAKSHEFDENGNETGSDYYRMMKIVLENGYNGYVGIEYEGTLHSEIEGIHLTNKLLKKIQNSTS